MRELRTCPVTGRTVLINEGWWAAPAPLPPPPSPCPVCSFTHPPIAHADGLRVLPHPNPALGIEGNPKPLTEHGAVRMEAVGAHELIFGDHHGLDHAAALRLGRQRIHDLRRDSRLRGFRLACRLIPGHHPLWQLWAFPFELRPSAPAGWRDLQVAVGKQVVAHTAGAVALMAWAPRVPFELWLMPDRGRSSFEKDDSAPIAGLFSQLLPRIKRAAGQVPLDLVVEEGEPWRLEILPTPANDSLLQAATGFPVHGTSPELALEFLRER